MIRGQNMSWGRWVAGEFVFVSPEKAQELKANQAEPGDLVFTQRGTLGQVALVPEGPFATYVISQSQMKVTIDKAKVDPMFLYYFFTGEEQKEYVRANAIQTGVPHTNLGILRDTLVLFPSLEEQVSISRMLGALDDKIDLNCRMNETLEATARAIFRSWFVDSTEQERSREWRQGRLGEVADNPRRGVDPAEMQSETPYIGLEHMPRKSIALDQWGASEDLTSGKFSFFRQEILFGKLRPYFHKVGVAPVDGVCSTDILVLVPKREIYFGLLLGYVSSEEFVSYTDRSSAGTKMPRTNWADMARYEITIPPDPVASAYSDLVRPLVERIIANIHESRTLATLRDTLLPKLLSGEIRVKQAEKLVGEAV